MKFLDPGATPKRNARPFPERGTSIPSSLNCRFHPGPGRVTPAAATPDNRPSGHPGWRQGAYRRRNRLWNRQAGRSAGCGPGRTGARGWRTPPAAAGVRGNGAGGRMSCFWPAGAVRTAAGPVRGPRTRPGPAWRRRSGRAVRHGGPWTRPWSTGSGRTAGGHGLAGRARRRRGCRAARSPPGGQARWTLRPPGDRLVELL